MAVHLTPLFIKLPVKLGQSVAVLNFPPGCLERLGFRPEIVAVVSLGETWPAMRFRPSGKAGKKQE